MGSAHNLWLRSGLVITVEVVSANTELREFLISRRDKLQPEEVGLPRGTRRRVPGLRREEVASLAAISVDYYVQVERGLAKGVSDDVLTAIARALRLNNAERTYLFELAGERSSHRPAPSHHCAKPTPTRLLLGLEQLLDAMVDDPALVQNGSLDIVAANKLGRALYRPVFENRPRPNLARYVFLDEDSLRFFDDWDAIADDAVAMLRLEQARTPSRVIDALITELSQQSDAFDVRWSARDVADHRRGTKVVHDAEVGELWLRYEALEVAGSPGLRLLGYTPNQTTQQRAMDCVCLPPWLRPIPRTAHLNCSDRDLGA